MSLHTPLLEAELMFYDVAIILMQIKNVALDILGI